MLHHSFLYIEDVIPIILSFMTTYEIYQFLYTSKEFMEKYTNKLYNESLWLKILNRDFPMFEQLNISFPNIDLNCHHRIAYMLEHGKICYNCYYYQQFNWCSHSLYLQDIYNFFMLTKREIKHLPNTLDGMYKIYSITQIFSLLSIKHQGITNFFIYKQQINQFIKWKNNYNKKFSYKRMTKKEKKTFLENTLKKYEIKPRPKSKLCKNFIIGKIKMNIEQLVVIIKVTNFLYSFGKEYYKQHHLEYKNKMEMLMFKNKQNKSFSWMNAYEEIVG